VDPTYFEAKLKPHEETSFSLHVSPEAISEALNAMDARNLSSIYLEIPYDMEEYIFWEPHFYQDVVPDSDVFFDVFVFTPFVRKPPRPSRYPSPSGGTEKSWGIRTSSSTSSPGMTRGMMTTIMGYTRIRVRWQSQPPWQP
jgi:hypothetical protein